MWSGNARSLDQFFNNANFQTSLMIIGIKDLLDIGTFDWWNDRRQSIVTLIEIFAAQHPNTKIILFTSFENLEIELQHPNIHIIPWGGDWLNQQAEYKILKPVLNKN